ncbi:HCP-like protein [Linnemannia elongata AG-77]|uniref:HCP-like protein n=1 Tax=Linnemannia elongata AG-77 TaxID=1314771 RepID=A0A197JL86_9FUNG|nr:HCP-like protein [Linnemannia elongata AG-77]
MEETQSFRIVGTTDTENIDVDNVNGQNVIFWEDIEQVFPGVQHIRNGSSVVKLLRDSNRIRIAPHCIKNYPGVVLDVVLATRTNQGHEDSPMEISKLAPTDGRTQTPIHAPIDELNVSLPACTTVTVAESVSGLAITADPLDDLLSTETHQATVTNITRHYSGSSASVTTENVPSSRDLTQKNIEKWVKTAAENVSFFGSNYAQTIWSEAPSTTSCAFKPLIVPTESEAGSLMSERVQDIRWEGRLSIEAADAQETRVQNAQWEGRLSIEAADAQKTQHQQQIQNVSAVSLQEDIPARTSFMLELANMIAKAEKGDHVAQETLGDMYMDREDQVAPNDIQTAIDWYLRADNQGRICEPIKEKLSRYYTRFKVDVTQECLTAVDRHRKAADQGDSTAQCNIGVLYFVVQNYYQAMNWYRKAAKQGDAAAQRNIGNLYHQGLGMSQDYAEAMTWYRKAAEQGDAAAQYNIGNLYYEGLGVSQDYAEAITWFQKAVEQGHVGAHVRMHYMYHGGHGVPHDAEKAWAWFQKASELGHRHSYIGFDSRSRKWTKSETKWF